MVEGIAKISRDRPSLFRSRRHCPTGTKGFTLIELMISLTVLMIGIIGILAMQMTSLRASGYSRHATEASVLAEDQMEALRSMPAGSIVNQGAPGQRVNAQGVVSATGLYSRTWSATLNLDNTFTVVVTVAWNERGTTPHAITLRGVRR